MSTHSKLCKTVDYTSGAANLPITTWAVKHALIQELSIATKHVDGVEDRMDGIYIRARRGKGEIYLHSVKGLTWSEIEEQGLVLDVAEAASISDVNVCGNGWAGEQVDNVVVAWVREGICSIYPACSTTSQKGSILRFRKVDAEALWHLQKIWNPSKALFLPECDFLPRVDIWLLQDWPPDDAVRHTEGMFPGVSAGFRVFCSEAYRSGWLGVRIAGYLATVRAEIGAGEGTSAGDEESRPSEYRKTSP